MLSLSFVKVHPIDVVFVLSSRYSLRGFLFSCLNRLHESTKSYEITHTKAPQNPCTYFNGIYRISHYRLASVEIHFVASNDCSGYELA